MQAIGPQAPPAQQQYDAWYQQPAHYERVHKDTARHDDSELVEDVDGQGGKYEVGAGQDDACGGYDPTGAATAKGTPFPRPRWLDSSRTRDTSRNVALV